MKKRQATLYIIQGFIASGKSTFSKKLSLETKAIHLNPDEWVTKLYEKEFCMNNWNDCFDNVLKKLWDDTKEYLNNGIDVIFDMGFWKKNDRDYARKIAFESGAICKHYYLYVPDEILKERIVFTRNEEWAKIHLQNFEKNKKQFEAPLKEEEAIVINNY